MKSAIASVLIMAAVAAGADGPRKLKPGFNLFSKDQDVQLGKEAATEIEKQYTLVNNSQLQAYLTSIGDKLAKTPEAGGYPYTFKLVSDKSINAFALPGGPSFVHTGLLSAAENEAQVAGVLAHEISHVALRHGTNQASKANLIQLPAILATAMAGQKGSMLGTLAQIGVGVGAGSVLLKFSRDAERDADLLGTRIMAKAGYNPLELARFFEKLEAEGGSRGPQFFSDHPNPGNRRKAIEAEIRYLPQANYGTGDAQQFAQMQRLVSALPPPPPKPQQTATSPQQSSPQPSGSAMPQVTPSPSLKEFRTQAYTISYPENWQAHSDSQSLGATFAPQEGILQNAIGIGVIANLSKPARSGGNLQLDTDDLVQQIVTSNQGMSVKGSRDDRVDGEPAMVVTMESPSPYANTTEVDVLITVERPQGLFQLILVAPQPQLQKLQSTFDAVVRSVRFAR